MALEDMTGTDKFIDAFINTNPVGSTDPMSDVDGHIQGVKNVLLNTIPNLTGQVTATHTELSVMDAGTTVSTPTVASGDAFVMDDLDVGMTQVGIDNVDTYLAATTKTLTNKTLTAPTITFPVMTTISNSGTVTIPAGTDTLAARTSTDTFTNKSIDADNNTITNIGASELETGSTEDTQTGTQSTPYVIPSGLHWIQVDATYTLTFEIQMNSSWRTVESGVAALAPRFTWSDGTNMRVSATNDAGVVRLLSMD